MSVLIVLGSLAWLALLVCPWRPWSTRERLTVAPLAGDTDLSNVAVLIPARNEADVIRSTLQGLSRQGRGLRVVLVDDQSSDDTVQQARGIFPGELEIVRGQPLPPGWMGKPWALEQARSKAGRPYLLLLDADIELAEGVVAELRHRLLNDNLHLVSLMAELRMRSFWEKLLLPAFVYFFKLLYPFALGNSPRSRLGVAAGGCILLQAGMLDELGGFASIRQAIIDDCTLAQRFKSAGCRTWIGLTRAAWSRRAYAGLGGIWEMVARSAFTQLRYSMLLLALTTAVMMLVFWFPWLGLWAPSPALRAVSGLGCLAMVVAYLPTLRDYGRSPWWARTLPVIGGLYLLMTWTSAMGYWRGRRSKWKGRAYGRV